MTIGVRISARLRRSALSVMGAPQSQNQKGAAAFGNGNPTDLIFTDSFEAQ